jgi:hypothetical protein
VIDVTPIATAAISGASAVVGGVFGYLAASRQSRVELRRVEADMERLRIEQSEPHLQHRQAVYHDFLDSAHRFHQAQSVEPFGGRRRLRDRVWGANGGIAEYQQWAREFEHHLSAVSLFGTEDAWQAAQRLADVIEEALGADQYDGEVEIRFLTAWDQTVRAMRLDSAPEAHG